MDLCNLYFLTVLFVTLKKNTFAVPRFVFILLTTFACFFPPPTALQRGTTSIYVIATSLNYYLYKSSQLIACHFPPVQKSTGPVNNGICHILHGGKLGTIKIRHRSGYIKKKNLHRDLQRSQLRVQGSV